MRVTLFILIVLAVAACKNKAQIAQEEKTESALPLATNNHDNSPERLQSDQPEKRIENKGIILQPNFSFSSNLVPINFDSVFIQRDTLYISVVYSGGCKKHEFSLIHNGMYMESAPPQLALYLKHNSNGDACRARIQETLAFDLTPLKYEKSGTLKLRLTHFEKVLTYTY